MEGHGIYKTTKVLSQDAEMILLKVESQAADQKVETFILRKVKGGTSYEKTGVTHVGFSKIQESWEESGWFCTVEEYLPKTLKELIDFYKKQNSSFPSVLAKIYSFQLLKLIAYAKLKNLLLNLQPDKIRVDTKTQRIAISLFDTVEISSKESKGKVSASSLFKKNIYSSPERLLESKNISFESDVFSLGCIMAEMVLLRPLFTVESGSNDPKDQLSRMVQVLGEPSIADKNSLINPISSWPLQPTTQTNQPTTKLLDILKSSNSEIEPDFFTILSKMLLWTPSTRALPQMLMIHQFFTPVLTQQVKVNGQEILPLANFSLLEQTCYGEYYQQLPILK